MTTILVTGARNLRDTQLVYTALWRREPDLVLVGDCPTGADRDARAWCVHERVPGEIFCASAEPREWPALFKVTLVSDWRLQRNQAGPLRNRAMVARAVDLKATVLAFPRGGPGTANCIRLAQHAGLSVELL